MKMTQQIPTGQNTMLTDDTQKSWEYRQGMTLEEIAANISTEYAASYANTIFYRTLKKKWELAPFPKWTVEDGKNACIKAALSYTYLIWDRATKRTKAAWRQRNILTPVDLLQQFYD